MPHLVAAPPHEKVTQHGGHGVEPMPSEKESQAEQPDLKQQDPGTSAVWPAAVADDMKSEGTADCVITPEQAKRLWVAVYTNLVSYTFMQACYFIIGVQLAYALNYIVSGDVNVASPQSQVYNSAASILSLCFSIAVQELWGQGGGWWGRKKLLNFMAVVLAITCVVSLIANLLKAAWLHVLIFGFSGLTGGNFAQCLGYNADVSLRETFERNSGMLNAGAAIGAVLGMVCIAVLAFSIHVTYAASVLLSASALVLITFVMPDWSPPKEKRPPWTAAMAGKALMVCTMFNTWRKHTAHTRCLLMTGFFSAAGFSCLRMWIFQYALLRYGLTSQLSGIYILTGFFVVAVSIGVGTPLVGAKRGADFLVWTHPLFALIITLGPPKPIVLWLAFLGYAPSSIGGSFINALYFGQISPKRRGELSGLHSMADKLGGLLGLLVISPLCYAWVKDYEEKGSSNLPTPPLIQLLFDILCATFYYIARFCFGHQDKFGTFVLRVEDKTADGDTPSEEKVKAEDMVVL